MEASFSAAVSSSTDVAPISAGYRKPLPTLAAMPSPSSLAPCHRPEPLISETHRLPDTPAEIKKLRAALLTTAPSKFGFRKSREARDYKRQRINRQIITILLLRNDKCDCGKQMNAAGSDGKARARLVDGSLKCQQCAEPADETNDQTRWTITEEIPENTTRSIVLTALRKLKANSESAIASHQDSPQVVSFTAPKLASGIPVLPLKTLCRITCIGEVNPDGSISMAPDELARLISGARK